MADLGPIAALSAAGEAAGSQAQFAQLLQLIAQIVGAITNPGLVTAWTPVDASGAALTFAAASGAHLQLGHLLVAQFNVTYPATANASAAKIGGLPVNLAASMLGIAAQNTDNSTNIYPLANSGTTNFSLNKDSLSTHWTNAALTGAVVAGTLIAFI